MTPAALDIETVPIREAVERRLSDPPEFTAPGNYKDPDKIEAYVESKRAEWEDKLRSEAALSELTGRVVAVGIVNDDRGIATAQEDEAELVRLAADELANCNRVVTFNGSSFDLRFLRNRMLMHGISPPTVLGSESRYALQRQVDLRDFLTGFDRYQRGKLDEWCAAFGLAVGIVEHEPEEIAEAFEEGDLAWLEMVVGADARAAWELYRKVETGLPALRGRR